MLLAEANMWPEDAIQYFGNGDECHMNFHFPLMPRLFMAQRLEDRFPIIDIMKQTPAIPETCQWALFLRNHDELTLEMVTDEERDYMYRTYAEDRKARINLGIRRRLAPLLGRQPPQNRTDERAAVLAARHAGDLLRRRNRHGRQLLSGRPQRRPHADAVGADRNAGFSDANPQKLYLPVNHRSGISLRSAQRGGAAEQSELAAVVDAAADPVAQAAIRRSAAGTLEFLYPENRARAGLSAGSYEGETILVIANLSRFVQPVALNLHKFQGFTPVEMFGGTEFPGGRRSSIICFTLGPNAFYWFSLEARQPSGLQVASLHFPRFRCWSAPGRTFGASRAAPRWSALFRACFPAAAGFWASAGVSASVAVHDTIPVEKDFSAFILVRIEYHEGEPEFYGLSLRARDRRKGGAREKRVRDVILTEVTNAEGEQGMVFGAMWDKDFSNALLEGIARRRKFRGRRGELVAWRTRASASSGDRAIPIWNRTACTPNSATIPSHMATVSS